MKTMAKMFGAVVFLLMTTSAFAQAPNLKLPWQASESWTLTCGYGCDFHTDAYNSYYALDFNDPDIQGQDVIPGEPVLAPASGVVIFAGSEGGFGYTVKIDAGNGYVIRLAHLRYAPYVNVDDYVFQGEQVGIMGRTGDDDYNDHIHMQMYYNGVCEEAEPNSKPEPMSGYTGFAEDQSYTSDNTIIPAPISYYRLNESSGTTTQDATENDNDGTLYGNAAFVSGCLEGNCVEFDGFADYIEIADADELDFSASMTVQAWVWFAGNHSGQASDSEVIVQKYNTSSAYLLYRDGADGKLKFSIGESDCSTTHTAASADVLSGGVWYHVAGVYDQAAGELKIYVNGKQSGSPVSYNGSVYVSIIEDN